MREQPIEKDQIPHISLFLSWLPLFKKLDESSLQDLVSTMTIVHLGGGETLIHQGEIDRSLYILWHGRMRVAQDGKKRTEISVGEVVGEISLLTGEPRTATVQAIRDSVLIKLAPSQFDHFEKLHPEGVAAIAKTAITRLIHAPHPSQPGENSVTIVVAPAGNSNHVSFAQHLARELNKSGSAILVNAEECNRHFDKDIAQAKFDQPESIAINSWLTSLEDSYRYVLFETDHQNSTWTKRCVRHADVIYLIAEEGKQRKNNEIEEQIYSRRERGVEPQTVIVFTHPEGQTKISGTHNWLRTRPALSYQHVQMGVDRDVARLVRFINGNAFGLVLNGGGMRGFAHVGVLKALEELKIPIDYIGGCSIGAAIGGAYARVGLEESINICYMKELPNTSTDYTFPLVSLLTGKNVCAFYQKIYDEDFIEDLKIPFFCVSSDLAQSKLHVHERGILWKAVRASSSIPAVYPPMYNSEGGMLVDGALINNMPVDVMRSCLMGGKILAVDCNIEPLHKNKIIKKPWLSGWKLFFQSALKREVEYDNIFKIIRTSFMFSSENKQEAMKQEADYLVEIETQKFGILKLQDMDELIEQGYRSAMEQLPAQLESDI